MALTAVTKLTELTNTCSEVEELLFIGVSLGLEASHIFNLHKNMREILLSLFPDEQTVRSDSLPGSACREAILGLSPAQ